MRRLTITVEWGKDEDPPPREGHADALVERADTWTPPLGFAGPRAFPLDTPE